MKIDRNNYEIYFLDYLEGRLTTEETAALLLFADENPDLKELLEGEEMISLVPDETIGFYPKSALKKKTMGGDESKSAIYSSTQKKSAVNEPEITERNYEELMVRFYEKELEEHEESALAGFMKDNPTYIKEFEFFDSTLLKPDTHIIYPYKSRLKRNFIALSGTKSVFAIAAVAAAVLLFSTLFLKYIIEPTQKENLLAGSLNKPTGVVKQVTAKVNTTGIHLAEINLANNSNQPNHSDKNNTASGIKIASTLSTTEPGNLIKKTTNTVRSTFEVPSSLLTRKTSLLAIAPIKAPQTIDRRTDFDGITSVAYYDPDPDALPLKTEGRAIGGRLGYTLANGISQTAGTIAREPGLGRLLRGQISLSDLAGLGLAGYNLITDSKLSVSRKYDADGNMKGYTIVDGNKKTE